MTSAQIAASRHVPSVSLKNCDSGGKKPVSSEILIKAARRGVPLVVSRSAPTKLALELDDQFGITVVGFARGQQFSIYSHKEKMIL